jgi:hypothetical protein
MISTDGIKKTAQIILLLEQRALTSKPVIHLGPAHAGCRIHSLTPVFDRRTALSHLNYDAIKASQDRVAVPMPEDRNFTANSVNIGKYP